MGSTDAQKAKDNGNAAFKAGAFPEAIGHYTTAILADRTDPTYPLNRAAAYLKLGKNEDAERDCTTTLGLKPGHVKALFRRAQARLELQKWDDAQKDLKEALKIEPENDAVKAELKRAEEAMLKAIKAKGKKSTTPIGMPSTVTTPPKRRRVPIAIVEPPEFPVVTPPTSTPLPPAPSTDALTPISTRTLTSPSSPSTASSQPERAPSSASSFNAGQSVRDAPRPPGVGGGIFRSSGKHTLVRPLSPPDTRHDSDKSPQPRAMVSHIEKIPEVEKETEKVKHNKSLKPPMSLFAFTRAWDTLAATTDRYNLICQISPLAFPTLFQTSLEPPLLVSVLETFSDMLDVAGPLSADQMRIKEYMAAFPSVPRFGTLLLFMNTREKELARMICATVGVDVGWNL